MKNGIIISLFSLLSLNCSAQNQINELSHQDSLNYRKYLGKPLSTFLDSSGLKFIKQSPDVYLCRLIGYYFSTEDKTKVRVRFETFKFLTNEIDCESNWDFQILRKEKIMSIDVTKGKLTKSFQ